MRSGPLELSLNEVRRLWWWFQDGSIMSPRIRQQLRHAWGFCPRHTWAHAAVECELRGRPFSTANLYRDLAARAAEALTSPSPSKRRRRSPPHPVERLRASAACVVCATLATSTAPPDPGFAERRELVNRLERTRGYLADLRPVWEPASCPGCLGGTGMVCRPHLLAGEPSSVDLSEYAHRLRELAGRLDLLVDSMTLHGPVATPEAAAAWVEALGWFAGWGLAHTLAGSVSPFRP